jgi:large subunit ribosomal protein L25
MEQVQLQATLRKKEETGKGFAIAMRKTGFVPAVVYKAGKETITIAVNEKEFEKALHTSAGGNVLIELKISGADAKQQSRTVIIKEIQHHPYKDNVLHVDFHQIALDEVIKVKVPIETKGEALGVKAGGILEHIMWEIEIECLPTQIPEKLEIDVADLDLNHTKTVKDLVVPSGIKILAEPEQIVVSITAKKTVEEAVAVPEGEAAEPEVLREKKLTPEEEAAAAAEAPPKEDKKPKDEKK